jgi:hypothetical protein
MVLLELLSGTEAGSDTEETNYNFTIVATDAESQTASRAFTITVTLPKLTMQDNLIRRL